MSASSRRKSALSSQVRDVIRTRKLNPHEVAVRAGITPSIMTRFVSGERDNLSLPTFEHVCAALGLKVKLVSTRKGLGTDAQVVDHPGG